MFTVPRRYFQAAEDLNLLTLMRLHVNTDGYGAQSNHCPVVPLQNVRKDAFEALIEVVRSEYVPITLFSKICNDQGA